MQPVRWVGPAFLVAGLGVLLVAAARGEASLYLVIIVPVVAASGAVGFLGILLIFAGFFLTFLLSPARLDPRPSPPHLLANPTPNESAAARRRWGGVVFLGPLPIVFGSDSRITRAMFLLGLALFLALLALTLFALLA